MTLIEGHAEHTMDAIGAEVLPSLPRLRAALNRRREVRSLPWRVLERFLGLEMKLRQYEVGRRFCDAVVDEGGPEALALAWSGPEALPSTAELQAPAQWLARTAPRDLAPRPRSAGSNACSACYKLACAEALPLQGFRVVVGCSCNNLSGTGYKQVFGASVSIGHPKRDQIRIHFLESRGRRGEPPRMPTANTTSPRSTKTGVKSAGKRRAGKAGARRKAAARSATRAKRARSAARTRTATRPRRPSARPTRNA